MEQRHYLALARLHEETELAKRLTSVNHFHLRLTNMIRSMDPTTEIFLEHYRANYQPWNTDELANLILNIVWLRNSLFNDVVKMVQEGRMP